MNEGLMEFNLPPERSSIIKVLGVGGGGSNAVNYMYRQGIRDVNFVICNTDAQALNSSPVPVKIQIGEAITEGRGAGSKPEIGKQAAEENLNDIMNTLGDNTKMVFVTAGMGGGTGTGAAPVIARACKEKGILTVAIVTIPFRFEGQKRINQAIEGIDELRHYVDSLLVINNEKLREVYGDLKLSAAFSRADNILSLAAKGIAEIITVHGYINVDFADVETVVRDSGVAILGSGSSSGEDRARKAIEEALNSPLLNSNDITGAKSILLNITSGKNEISMDEVGEITDYVNASAADDALIIWGTCTDEAMEDEVNVTIIATGFPANSIPELYTYHKKKKSIPLEGSFFDNPELEVTGKSRKGNTYKLDEFNEAQQTLEFNVSDASHEHHTSIIPRKKRSSKENSDDKDAKRMEEIKTRQTILHGNDMNVIPKDEEIQRLEDEPAYKRKKVKLDEMFTPSAKRKISKYSLIVDEEENETKLSDENPYLNDNVD
ncbi:MAG: cell division protein FtsZ [Bacteroidales bacterium]|nr:cell division protein FtsZ [Bacteroidales bacterium]